ncbi:MAG: TetR/AcrR family transcriptional regulator [Acidobacteria bacterium]|nr:TetR/AcrR family transcriptional regulator [Acidobacteriota bacterium]
MAARGIRRSPAVARHISANVSQRHAAAGNKDKRVRRTRARIDAAFVELLHRRSYGNIRVADICRKADVGRATFYAHYRNKDELLRSQVQRIVMPMLRISPQSRCLLDATTLFEHIYTSPHFYKTLMGPGSGTAPRILRDCFEAHARKALDAGGDPNSGFKRSALARFVASSLIVIVDCWLERGGREQPRELQDLFAILAGPGVRACRQP